LIWSPAERGSYLTARGTDCRPLGAFLGLLLGGGGGWARACCCWRPICVAPWSLSSLGSRRARVSLDTPPLTAVSDAFPLLKKVDGVVIVGRVGRNRRDVAERLHDTLAGAGAGAGAGAVLAGLRGRAPKYEPLL
jgi:hypothetical protein